MTSRIRRRTTAELATLPATEAASPLAAIPPAEAESPAQEQPAPATIHSFADAKPSVRPQPGYHVKAARARRQHDRQLSLF